MQGPAASEASTSSGSPTAPSSKQQGGLPSLGVDFGRNGCAEVRYEQPDFATRTQDETIPTFETKHAGVSALRRIFIGPSYTGSRTADPFDVQGRSKSQPTAIEEVSRRALPFHGRKRSATGASRLSDGSNRPIQHGSHRGEANDDSLGWKGASFEIGGDIREAAKRRDARLARQKAEAEQASQLPPASPADRHSLPAISADSLFPPKSPALSSMTGASFVTAQTELPTPDLSSGRPSFTESPGSPLSTPLDSTTKAPLPAIHVSHADFAAGASRDSEHRPDLPRLRSILRTRNTPAGSHASFRTAHSETIPSPAVRFPQDPSQAQTGEPGSGAAPPAPPTEVLARPDGDAIAVPTGRERWSQALHGHAVAAAKRPRPKRGSDEVVRQERMLVRVDWTQRNDLPDVFDEHVAKKYPTVKESWEELAVVWRASNQIELWTEHGFNVAASLFKRKKLAAVIPLDSKATKLSVYSMTDLVFCLTFRPESRAHILSRTKHTTARDDGSRDGVTAETTRTARHAKSSKRGYLHLRSSGTNIFLFRARTHAIAKEWLWRLYRCLGGRLPALLEVRVPGLDAKLFFRIPRDHDPDGDVVYDRSDEDEGYRHLQPSAVVEKCIERLSTVAAWKDLVDAADRQGTNFRLAWRRGSTLDWIADPVPGEAYPDWAVVGGFAFRQAHVTPVLELRPAAHYPTTCRVPASESADRSRLSSTVRIAEPPGIEGFAIRISARGRSQRIYLSSRMNLLFRNRPTLAHPPDPPLQVHEAMNNPAAVVLAPFIAGMATLAQPDKKKREKIWSPIARSVLRDRSHEHRKHRDRAFQSLDFAEIADEAFGRPKDQDEFDDSAANCDGNMMLEYLDTIEKKRAFLQITDSQGYIEFNEIAAVKPELESGPAGVDDDPDKATARKLRTLIVSFHTGTTIKLECPTEEVRDEWVARLRALSTYWTRRRRVDAIQHMELGGADAMVNRIPARSEHRRRVFEDELDAAATPPRSRDEVLSSPHLSHLYNWCLLDGCRAIMKEGVMHVKRGLRGIYRLRHVVLLPGILVEFQNVARDLNGQPTPTPYHRRRRVLHLRDCYVYSGTLASHLSAPTANTGQWDPADESAHQFPRYYPGSDGLRSADEREDCTFVVFKISHKKSGADCKLGRKGKTNDAVVFRTRSKLERDLFVYALNLSIERLLRGEKQREDRLREFPWLSEMK